MCSGCASSAGASSSVRAWRACPSPRSTRYLSASRGSGPGIAEMPLLAAVVGAIFVGGGVGICVLAGGAPGGDDALAMSVGKLLRCNVQWVYLAADIVVLARVAELHPPAPHRLLAADRRALRRDNRPTAADVHEECTGRSRARRTGGGINDHEPAAMNAHHGRLVIFSLSMSGFISCSARGCGRRRSCRRCQFPCCDTSCCIVDIYIIFGGGLTYDKNLPAA